MPEGEFLLPVLRSTFKSETMIYWISIVKVPQKAEDTIFRYLRGLDFLEDDWLPKKDEQETEEAAEALPY